MKQSSYSNPRKFSSIKVLYGSHDRCAIWESRQMCYMGVTTDVLMVVTTDVFMVVTTDVLYGSHDRCAIW